MQKETTQPWLQGTQMALPPLRAEICSERGGPWGSGITLCGFSGRGEGLTVSFEPNFPWLLGCEPLTTGRTLRFYGRYLLRLQFIFPFIFNFYVPFIFHLWGFTSLLKLFFFGTSENEVEGMGGPHGSLEYDGWRDAQERSISVLWNGDNIGRTLNKVVVPLICLTSISKWGLKKPFQASGFPVSVSVFSNGG